MRALVPFHVEDNVLDTIASSGWLSSRVAVLQTEEQATKFYNEVIQIPWSETRAEVFLESNVKIDGLMPIRGAQTATFHYAFEDDLPKVLKIPEAQLKVSRECALYEQLGALAEEKSLAMVPVRKLKLRGGIRTNRVSPEKLVHEGILMPPYWCTLGDIPAPVSKKRLLDVLSRVSMALKFIHANNWIHGDLKPHNIFIDAKGVAWLGDYGSSVPMASASLFTGGTPKYQLTCVTIADGGRLDRFGLALSLLEALGVRYDVNWTVEEIRSNVSESIKDADIRSGLMDLFQ